MQTKRTAQTVQETIANSLDARGYYFDDSDGIVFKSLDLLYKREGITEDISLGGDIGIFSIEQKGGQKYSGTRYGIDLFYSHFDLRLGFNKFSDYSEFVPTIKYHNNYENQSYLFEYTRQNALFYTYSLVPYEKKIIANHFSVSDYIVFENKTNLWANIVVNFFSNDDREITGQFDWIFYQNTLFSPKFSYTLALEGWYTSHSRQHTDFYSPSFTDATLLRFNPQYEFSKWFGLKAKLGIGHSFHDEIEPYKYGLWAFGKPTKNLFYLAGCLNSNAARLANGPTYHYTECEVKVGYKW